MKPMWDLAQDLWALKQAAEERIVALNEEQEAYIKAWEAEDKLRKKKAKKNKGVVENPLDLDFSLNVHPFELQLSTAQGQAEAYARAFSVVLNNIESKSIKRSK